MRSLTEKRERLLLELALRLGRVCADDLIAQRGEIIGPWRRLAEAETRAAAVLADYLAAGFLKKTAARGVYRLTPDGNRRLRDLTEPAAAPPKVIECEVTIRSATEAGDPLAVIEGRIRGAIPPGVYRARLERIK